MDTAKRNIQMLAQDIMRYAGVGPDNARNVMEQNATKAEAPDQGERTSWVTKVTSGLASGARSTVDRLRQVLRRD